jgi:hypothetical protein
VPAPWVYWRQSRVTREMERHFLSTGASPRGGGNLWHFFNYAEFNGLAVQ